MKRPATILLALLLAGCGADPVTVGAKDTPENRILARMMAILLEERGVPVERRIPIGDTERTFAALRRGAIDVYPEYAGTGLALLGREPISNPDAALDAVRDGFDAFGLDWLAPFGFDAGYVVAAATPVAARHNLDTIEDLADAAPALRLGVTETFARRTGDGLRPWLDRYGLAFSEVEIISGADRGPLYDRLVVGEFDVIVGASTDPDMETLGLAALGDTDDFFPAYPAAPLVRRDASRAAVVAEVAEMLSGRIDAETARELNAAVVIEGLPPREVAARTLVRLGLVDRATGQETPSFLVALTPAERGGEAANRALRALREAVRGRRIEPLADPAPLAAMGDGRARLALAPAVAHFDIVDGRARLRPGVETVAVLGSSHVHAFTTAGGPGRLGDARRIGAGPAGSPSHKLATALAAHVATPPEIVALPGGAASDIAAALRADEIDAGLVIAELGRADIVAALDSGGLKLANAVSWWRGPARIDLPFLREARLPRSAYGGEQVQTLSMQLTLAGPAPGTGDPLGRSGPSVVAAQPEPLTRTVTRRLDAALGGQEAVSPHLRAAAALKPEIPRARSVVGFTPDRGVLLVAITSFVLWAVWLSIRPRRR